MAQKCHLDGFPRLADSPRVAAFTLAEAKAKLEEWKSAETKVAESHHGHPAEKFRDGVVPYA